jgi:hypothetical protein
MVWRRISIWIRFYTISPILLLLCSCEEIIDVNLNNVQPEVVIESYITTENHSFLVKITKSQAFFDQSNVTVVKNASVQLCYLSAKEKLSEKENGYYACSNTKSIPGTSYTLNVVSEGKTYAATVKLPPVVPIDSVYFQPGIFQTDSLNVVVEFRDPPQTENYYRLKFYRNGRYAINDYFLVSDAFSNGEKIVAPVYYRYFAPGDTVVVELLNLDRCTWRYLKGISESIQLGINTQAPGNPPTNITGGALGIFGAWGSSIYRVINKKSTLKK